jgi:hypothetical protein
MTPNVRKHTADHVFVIANNVQQSWRFDATTARGGFKGFWDDRFFADQRTSGLSPNFAARACVMRRGRTCRGLEKFNSPMSSDEPDLFHFD